MSVKTSHVIRLIETAAQKVGESLDYYGFGRMSDSIAEEAITQKYLDDLYRNMMRKLDMGQMRARPSQLYLDHIARFLGHRNFHAFSRSCEAIQSETLMSCLGNWWSLVRASNGNYILRSPVSITENEQGQVKMTLIGKEQAFEGQLEMGFNCIFGLLHSGWEKRISLVFKIATSPQLRMIQGVFCGVSQYGEPMAGREILVRETELAYDDMKWSRMPLDDARLDPSIKDYFADVTANCLQTDRLPFLEFEDFRSWN